jgi:hypothetical protein
MVYFSGVVLSAAISFILYIHGVRRPILRCAFATAFAAAGDIRLAAAAPGRKRNP